MLYLQGHWCSASPIVLLGTKASTARHLVICRRKADAGLSLSLGLGLGQSHAT
jgi:hypothetical protein